jgi:hypothetical protein
MSSKPQLRSAAPLLALALLSVSCGNDDRGDDGLFGGGDTGADGGADGGGGGDDGGDGGDGGGDDGGGDDGGDGGGMKYDVASGTGGPGDDEEGDCGCGNDEWSYIWVSNSAQSTVSKINTRSVAEEGRYYTRADANGNPSRTSVSLGARAVAVANRNGGVIKIFARDQFCEDRNGNGSIDTSTGAADIMPWDQDECVAWFTDFPDYTTQRPIAWAGDVDPQTCDDGKLWTSGCNDATNVFVHLLDGNDGTVLDTVEIVGMTCGGFGAYGGAVDPDGNFWIMQNGGGIAFIDLQTMDYVVHGPPPGFSGYGITVDNMARVWLSGYAAPYGAARFDPVTESWATATGFPEVGQGGIQQGEDLRIWLSTGNGIAWVDPETLVVGGSFDGAIVTPNGTASGTVKGISLDVDGYVWSVIGSGAKKTDPDTLQMVDAYTGLNGAYTYSDMTGWGLQNANCNPPEG